MNGYDLSKAWFNFRSGKNEIKASHTELYFFVVDLWNRLGQPKEFGLPTDSTMNALAIGSYHTYKKTLEGLIKFGLIKEISGAKNQYQSRRIALAKFAKASAKAPAEASAEATAETLATISIVDNTTIQTGKNHEEPLKTDRRFSPPTLEEVEAYILEKKYKTVAAASFWNFYQSKNWMVGKNKMKDWKSAIGGWESRNEKNNGKYTSNSGNGQGPGRVSGRSAVASGAADYGEFA